MDNNVHEYPFIDDGNKLAKIIKLSIKTQLKQDLEIDAFVLSYIDKEVISEIYYKNEKGEKQFTQLNL